MWERLLDERKLPFMAMLRNLRNLLQTGVSAAHHATVVSKLADEATVAASRQFPFSFFSAYEAVSIDIDAFAAAIDAQTEAARAAERLAAATGGGGRGRGGGRVAL